MCHGIINRVSFPLLKQNKVSNTFLGPPDFKVRWNTKKKIIKAVKLIEIMKYHLVLMGIYTSHTKFNGHHQNTFKIFYIQIKIFHSASRCAKSISGGTHHGNNREFQIHLLKGKC